MCPVAVVKKGVFLADVVGIIVCPVVVWDVVVCCPVAVVDVGVCPVAAV